jgi:trigger factor
MKARVRQELLEQADRAGTERLQHTLLEKVVDANPFEAPKALVEALLNDLVQQQRQEAAYRGEDPEAVDGTRIKDANRAAADRQVRRMLVLDAIAKAEAIRATEEEVRERVTRMARLRGMPVRKLIEQLGGDRFLRRLSRELRDKKVLAFLSENAEITTKTVSAATA